MELGKTESSPIKEFNQTTNYYFKLLKMYIYDQNHKTPRRKQDLV